MNYEQAMSKLATYSWQDLYENCSESYKDFYGYRGCHMTTYTKLELLNWWDNHFMWDNDEQMWRNQVPFVEDFIDSDLDNNEQADWYDTSKELY